MPQRFRVACHRYAGLALLSLAMLVAAFPASARPDLRGQWTGKLATDKGTCPDSVSSSLSITASEVTFAPADGSLVLHGKPHKDETVHAELIGSDRNRKPLPMVFDGHLVGTSIEGSYGTPSCRAHITLKRPD